MMQNNDIGKRDTLTVDWLNIWKHPKKQARAFHNIVSYYFDAILHRSDFIYLFDKYLTIQSCSQSIRSCM